MHYKLPVSELWESGNSPCLLPSLCHGYLCRSPFCLSLTPFFYTELFVICLFLETMLHSCSSLSPSSEGFFQLPVCSIQDLDASQIHRENHSISHSCPSLSDPIFILNCLLDCSWVLSWQCHRTNHSHPKVSFSSGKSCVKGPYPCSISYVLHVILSSVHYWMLLTISVCIIIANPTISFQKSPCKH